MARTVVSLHGDKELLATLKALPDKLQRKSLRNASRIAAKSVLGKAKAAAPVDTGNLRKWIKIRAMKRRKGRVGVVVGSGTKDYVGQAFYAAFIEFGHRQGKRRKEIRRTGTGKKKKEADTRAVVEPKPFLQPALEANQAEIEAVYVKEIRDQINSMRAK